MLDSNFTPHRLALNIAGEYYCVDCGDLIVIPPFDDNAPPEEKLANLQYGFTRFLTESCSAPGAARYMENALPIPPNPPIPPVPPDAKVAVARVTTYIDIPGEEEAPKGKPDA